MIYIFNKIFFFFINLGKKANYYPRNRERDSLVESVFGIDEAH
jgi:hypothetical protein